MSRRTDRDAQASLFVNGPAMGVQTIWTALDLRASSTSADDERTLDQRRFDALVDICRLASTDAALLAAASAGGSPDPFLRGARPPARLRAGPGGAQRRDRTGLEPAVFVFADAATWAGLADEPVELDGYGPIPAGVARECFTDATWRAVVTDAVTGAAVSVSDTTYRPSARTRRMLYVKDRRCGFPGCSAAVWFCDADHSVPHELGGCTDAENCGLFCRRHHRLKTFTAWRWRRLPDGTLEWTDPSGRTWRRGPPAVFRLPEVRALDRDDAPGQAAGIPEISRAPRDGPGPIRARSVGAPATAGRDPALLTHPHPDTTRSHHAHRGQPRLARPGGRPGHRVRPDVRRLHPVRRRWRLRGPRLLRRRRTTSHRFAYTVGLFGLNHPELVTVGTLDRDVGGGAQPRGRAVSWTART